MKLRFPSCHTVDAEILDNNGEQIPNVTEVLFRADGTKQKSLLRLTLLPKDLEIEAGGPITVRCARCGEEHECRPTS